MGNEAIKTTADWDRALRSNQNKPVQVTILRDGKQQVLNLQVDSKHNKSEVDEQDIFPGLLPDGPCPLLAELDPGWAADTQLFAEKLREQADALRRNFNPDDFKIDQRQIDELKNQMEQLRDQLNAGGFKIDQKQIEDLKRQMEEFRKSMPELFNKQLEQFRRDMEQMRLDLSQHV